MGEAVSDPEVPLGRRERKKQELRDRMVEAARTLFDQKGFEATTVDEICALADVAQKTFFNYFPTKHHVVRVIADEFLADVGAYVEEARKRPGTTAERLARLFHRAGEEAVRAGPRHKELVIEVARMSQVDGSGPAKNRRLHAAFGSLLADADDLTREHDAAFLTEMVIAVFVGILLNWQSVEGYPVREHLDEAARFLGKAISKPGVAR